MGDISKLALVIGGKAEGDDGSKLTGLSGFDTAKAGDLTFAADDQKLAIAEKSGASCILVTMTARKSTKPVIRVKNPKLAFLKVYNMFNKRPTRKGEVHSSAIVSPEARLGRDAWIGPNVVIEENVVIGNNVIIEANTTVQRNSSIGDGCHIHPNVTLYPNTQLRKNVILHSGVVIGADGFGYVREDDKIYKFPQLGRVIIEDDVEIGANTTIDRGALGDTVIGTGSKIDNLCQIAHNVKVGRNMLMAAQSGVSGSVTIKDNVMLGGQVGIADNTTIGNNVILAAQSGVMGTIEDNSVLWGTPPHPIMFTKRQAAATAWLTRNFVRISKLLKEQG